MPPEPRDDEQEFHPDTEQLECAMLPNLLFRAVWRDDASFMNCSLAALNQSFHAPEKRQKGSTQVENFHLQIVANYFRRRFRCLVCLPHKGSLAYIHMQWRARVFLNNLEACCRRAFVS